MRKCLWWGREKQNYSPCFSLMLKFLLPALLSCIPKSLSPVISSLAWGTWRNENVRRWDDCDPHPKLSLASSKPTAGKGKLDNGAHAGWNQKDCWQWPAPGQQGAKRGAGSGSGEKFTLCWRQGTWVQVSAPPLTCLITTGKLSVSKYLICKMGTGTMVPSSTTAWARDEGQPA